MVTRWCLDNWYTYPDSGNIHRLGRQELTPGGFPGDLVKNPPDNAGLIPGLERFPWRRDWLPTPVFLPGKSHGQRKLVGYSASMGS